MRPRSSSQAELEEDPAALREHRDALLSDQPSHAQPENAGSAHCDSEPTVDDDARCSSRASEVSPAKTLAWTPGASVPVDTPRTLASDDERAQWSRELLSDETSGLGTFDRRPLAFD